MLTSDLEMTRFGGTAERAHTKDKVFGTSAAMLSYAYEQAMLP